MNKKKILFIKRDNFSYYWRLILFITTIIYFLFSICCFIFYDMDTIENKALFLVFFIFSTFYNNFFFDDFKYSNSCYLIIGEEIGSDKDWFGWNIENKNSDRLGYLTKKVIRKIGTDSDGQILILTHKKFHLDLNNREIKVTDKFADKKDDVITFLKMNFDSQSK